MIARVCLTNLIGCLLCATSVAGHAAGCYDPTWDVGRAPQVSFADGSHYPVQVRAARANSSDASLLLVKGSAPAYWCVPVGPRLGKVQYPFQGDARVDSVALAKAHLIVIAGRYSGGSDCCQLVQFLAIEPGSGAAHPTLQGGFVLSNLARIRYGVSQQGQLVVLTAERIVTDNMPLEGPRRYRLARYRYSLRSSSFHKVSERESSREYDLARTADDIFAEEGINLEGRIATAQRQR